MISYHQLSIQDDKVPTTDSEVEDLMIKDFKQPVAESMMCIYRVRRAQGATVLDAYMDTLEAYIRACKENMPKRPA